MLGAEHADKPLVSVLMPVFNGSRFLAEAIHSIQLQTFADWELIIIDDGSTDESVAIASSFASRDSRIKVHRFHHQGLVGTLNTGIGLCRGPYIARMDCDDIALPRRLEKQVSYLESNPTSAIVGCLTSTLPLKLHALLVPKTPLECKWQLTFRNCVGHPGVTVRTRDLPRTPYREDYFLAEDFKLWSEISQVSDVHVISQQLLRYRKHSGSISSRNSASQASMNRRIVAENLQMSLKIDLSNHVDESSYRWALAVMRSVLDATMQPSFELSESAHAALQRGLQIYLPIFGPAVYFQYLVTAPMRILRARLALTFLNLIRSLAHFRRASA